MIHAATREELIAGVEICARVLHDLGREMLVDRLSLEDFVNRAREYSLAGSEALDN
jgi:hypothetical protein